MAEIKNKVVTVESLKTKHDYDEGTYLKKNEAENTYLTSANAITTYLTNESAESTYLSKSEAKNVYLTSANAEVTYLNKNNVTPCCTFTGEDSAQLITSDEVTIANLTTFVVNTNGEYFSASDNGVKVLQSGYYQVSASAYLTCDSSSGIRSIYMFKNEDGLIQGEDVITPKVIYVEADDVIYLKVGTSMSDGTLVPNSGSTYISIIKM